jgi:hypothetical protein
MIKWLICYFKGHEWVESFHLPYGVDAKLFRLFPCLYCPRCGKVKLNDE